MRPDSSLLNYTQNIRFSTRKKVHLLQLRKGRKEIVKGV